MCSWISTILRLTHWSRVTHICVGNLTIIGSDNGFSPGWRQAIIWTNAGILSNGPFSEILAEIVTFSFKEMNLKVSSAKWRPSWLCLNVLTLLVLQPKYSGRTSAILWLLLLLASSPPPIPPYQHGLTWIPAWINIISIIKCEVKLLIHSQTSTAAP